LTVFSHEKRKRIEITKSRFFIGWEFEEFDLIICFGQTLQGFETLGGLVGIDA
jgi:hypothetical protein